MINEVGNRYYALTVLKRVENDKHGKARWLCRCDCGNETIVVGSNLRKGNTKSCGCGIYNKQEKESKEIGKKYGKLTVVSFAGKTEYGKLLWNCKCDCGNQVIVQTGHLHSGAQKSCGKCYKLPVNFKDETGNRYGKLLVISRAESKNNEAYWNCQCDCGNTCIVSGAKLRSGNTSSCGCIKSIGEANIRKILEDNNIKFAQQYTFEDLRLVDKLKFDFCLLSEDNLPIRLIEFDGPQHSYTDKDKSKLYYNPTLQLRDSMKNQYCKINNIPLVRIPYKKRDSISLEDLLSSTYLIN